MHQDLFVLQENFEQYLRPGDYTFIGPIDRAYDKNFFLKVSDFAPGRFFGNSIHHALSNKEAVKKAVQIFSAAPMQLYVVTRIKGDSNTLLHSTLAEYCESHNIDFRM